jgi:hypothetical protein
MQLNTNIRHYEKIAQTAKMALDEAENRLAVQRVGLEVDFMPSSINYSK